MSEPVAEVRADEPESSEEPLEGDLPEDPIGEPGEPGEEPEAVVEEPEQPQATSDLDLERVSKKVDAAAGRYAKALAEHLGDDLGGWTSCPLCASGWPGIVLPRVPDHETVERVKNFIGEPTQPDYKPDTFSRPCTVCDGYGVVSTGSKVSGRGNAQCLECKGLGYIPTHSGRESGAVTVTNGATLPPSYDQAAPSLPEPPEVAALKALGYIVVEPVQPVGNV